MMRLGLIALAFASILAPVSAIAADASAGEENTGALLQRARAQVPVDDPALALAAQAKASAGTPSAADFAARARNQAAAQRCDLAIDDFNRAVELAPRDAAHYIGRAACLRALGKGEAAVEDLTLALRIDRTSAAAFKLRAHVRLAQGRMNEALTDLRWASGLDPRDVGLMQMLGYARFAAGDYETAAENLARSLRFRDDMRAMLMLYIARGQSWRNWGANRTELEKHVGYLRTREWPFPVVALYLGHGNAKDVLQRASTEAERCEANFYVGYFMQLQGRHLEATELLKTALRICPNTKIEYETISAKIHKTKF